MSNASFPRSVEIIIPAYNEEGTIGGLIRQIRNVAGADTRIMVVDDASSDATAEVARAAGAEVLKHPYRIGNGGCLKSGLRHARADVVVIMDADGQHDPNDLPRLLSKIDQFDMVIGARDFSSVSLRAMANRIYTGFARSITGFPILDLTCGFRAMRRAAAAPYTYLLPNGFSSPTTLTLAFLKSGRTITYVPIAQVSRSFGASKIRAIEDGMRFFLIIVKVATFFSPLRVFLPISIFFFLMGLAHYCYTFTVSHRFTNMSVLLFITALLIFMLGLVSEQISQLRMDRTEE